jgi:hypothetical protein
MRTFLSNNGSHIGNGDFVVTSVVTRRDSSHAASIIAFGETRVTERNGNMFGRILFGLVLLVGRRNGNFRER